MKDDAPITSEDKAVKRVSFAVLRTVELFSGTKSFSKVMAAHGNQTFTVDASFEFRPDLCMNILNLNTASVIFPEPVDILWASPPCQGFSVAAIGKNWNHDHTPKTDSARLGLALLSKTTSLIEELRPTWWFIENPRGKMRKVFPPNFLFRHHAVLKEISYCQYGDTRMKPTDIWTNAYWWKPRSICKNGDKCHESAPRGSKTGTQGLDGAMARGVIPPALFEEILEQMPK